MAKKDKDDKGTNADKDAIDTLPLSSIPLTSSALKNAKLIKNARMETTVEIHNDPVSGSLQVSPGSIADFMETTPRDQSIINSLASLHSFDVYSLRTNLKKLGVEVKDADALELSDDMKADLAAYGQEFIRPLVEKIFGQGHEDLYKDGLLKLSSGSDMARVRDNLRVIAEKTGIPLSEIPGFLKEYSDVFLSVAYYRYSFAGIGPDIDRFLIWMHEVRAFREVTTSVKTSAQCKQVEEIVKFLSYSMRERLAQFQESFEMFWEDINTVSFQQLRTQIEKNHSTMGPVLCGLVVKMHSWRKEFRDSQSGGPATRIKFIVAEMEPGLVKLKDLEVEARKQLWLGPVRA